MSVLRRVAPLALVLALASIACGRSESPPVQTIVLITLDTTRVDHLGAYGYPRETSPNLDALAAGGIVYEHALSPSTWTLPAHASLFTGKLPSHHGAHYADDGVLELRSAIAGPERWRAYRARPLAADEVTLAERLRARGYATAGVVAGPWLKGVFGLGRGFDTWDDNEIAELNGRPAWSVTEAALAWLHRPSERPRFLFLNYFDPHGPLQPPPAYVAELHASDRARGTQPPSDELDLYDAEIRYMDAQIGRLFDGLRELDLWSGAWIIVTADHGELFGEHGEHGHGEIPYQAVTHVPLIVKPPGDAQPARIGEWTPLTDVFSMILERVGAPLPKGVHATASSRELVVESRTTPAFSTRGDWRALIADGLELIESDRGVHMLFDLDHDPKETKDLAPAQPERTAALAQRLDDYVASLPAPGPQPPPTPVDAKTREALRQLGYTE